MRSKKNLKTKLDPKEYEKLQEAQADKNKKERQKSKLAKIEDKDLFSVNVNKGNLKQKREALKKDRFKRKAPEKTSIAEFYKVKKIQESLKRRPEVVEEKEYQDLWETNNEKKLGRKFARADQFLKKTELKVKPLVVPKAGLSYNPSAKEHQKVIKKVIEEEIVQIEDAEKVKQALNPDDYKSYAEIQERERREKQLLQEAELEDSDEEVQLMKNAAVKAENAKTKAQRNREKRHQELLLSQQLQKDQKKFEAQFNLNVNKLSRTNQKQLEETKRNQELMEQYLEQEKEVQLKEGIVSKPKRVGRFKYKMRKTDFQMEEELAASMRQMRPKTGADMLHERYDDIFRRNLIEPTVPEGAAGVKRKGKTQYKMHNTKREAVEKRQRKMAKEDKKHLQKGVASDWLNNDIVML